MKLTPTCFVALTTMVLVTANNLANHKLTDRELSAQARRMLQRAARACVNPTCSSPPCAAKLLGDVGCTTVSGVAEYNHELVRKGETIAANAHIYGPFEGGFTERQKNIISGWGCSDPSVVYDSAGGKDIGLATRETAYKCNMVFPRIEGDKYIGVVGKCGGHTHDYHFHGSFSCLYKQEGAHSTAVGKIGEHRIYGKWEDYSKKLLPLLDACGGHWGPTPDCAWCYHYHVQDRAPFTVGCMGPAADGGLVSIKTCRALYGSKCGDATEMISVGTDKAVKYDRFCPCYDADGSNVNTKELPALSTGAIAVHAETGEFFGGSTTAISSAETTAAAKTTAAAETSKSRPTPIARTTPKASSTRTTSRRTTAALPTKPTTNISTNKCKDPVKVSRDTCKVENAKTLAEACGHQLAKDCHEAGMGFGGGKGSGRGDRQTGEKKGSGNGGRQTGGKGSGNGDRQTGGKGSVNDRKTGGKGSGNGDRQTGGKGSGNGDMKTGGKGSGNGDRQTGGKGSGNGDRQTGGKGSGNGDRQTGEKGSGNGDRQTGGKGSGNGDRQTGGKGSGNGDRKTGGKGSGNGDRKTGGKGSGNGDRQTGGRGSGNGDMKTGGKGSGNGDRQTGGKGSGNGDRQTGGKGSGRGDKQTGDKGSGNGDRQTGGNGSGNGDRQTGGKGSGDGGKNSGLRGFTTKTVTVTGATTNEEQFAALQVAVSAGAMHVVFGTATVVCTTLMMLI